VHFIFGAILYVVFGAGPAAIGLAAGLLLQGLTFEPSDLPQYCINVTTLIVPLWFVSLLARRIVRHDTPYVGLKYWQALALSLAYQVGVIVFVAFWSLYGRGFGPDNLQAIATFGVSYLLVVVFEPVITLVTLALARRLDRHAKSPILYKRLHHPVT
jgi:ABC-type Co2+ transport system permease subunit